MTRGAWHNEKTFGVSGPRSEGEVVKQTKPDLDWKTLPWLKVQNGGTTALAEQAANALESFSSRTKSPTERFRAINLIDLEHEASDELVSQLKSIEHVLKVRSINTAS